MARDELMIKVSEVINSVLGKDVIERFDEQYTDQRGDSHDLQIVETIEGRDEESLLQRAKEWAIEKRPREFFLTSPVAPREGKPAAPKNKYRFTIHYNTR